MGTLVVTDKEARFSYENGYEKTGLRGLGLTYPPEVFTSTIVRPRNEYSDFHPPLRSLVPPRNERNFQRALVLKYLKKINVNPEPGFDTDWNILVRTGHGAIGHLDVFKDDENATQWYATPSKKGLVELDDKFGFSLKEFMTWFDNDVEASILDVIGPTPTVGGAIPKLLLSCNRDGWDGRIGLPTRFGDTGRTDILLKLENTTDYPGVVELETLGLEIHRDAGFEVPRFWPVMVNGLQALAIERFDRSENGSTVFMESIYSILASGNAEITNHYSATYDQIGRAIDEVSVQLVNDRKAAKTHLLKRLVLAMLTGNGDLHLENLSITERDGVLAFSPVYDPVAMRAYSKHNELAPPEMSFGNYGGYDENDDMVDFSTAVLRFTKNLGLTKNTLLEIISDFLKVTDDYDKRVDALQYLPADNKKNLIKIHKQIRQKFEDL